jgi:hypothetical protein
MLGSGVKWPLDNKQAPTNPPPYKILNTLALDLTLILPMELDTSEKEGGKLSFKAW